MSVEEAISPVWRLDDLNLDALRDRHVQMVPFIAWLRSHEVRVWPCWPCHRRQVRVLALLQATWLAAAKPGAAWDWWRYYVDFAERRWWNQECKDRHQIAAQGTSPDGFKRESVPTLEEWLARQEFEDLWRTKAGA